MRIKVGILVGFLKRVVLTGNSTISSGILDFKEDGVEFIALSNDTSVLSYGLLRAKSFDEYEPLGQLAFQSLGNVIKLLENFGASKIRIVKKENALVLKSKARTVSLLLMDTSFVDRPKELPQTKYSSMVVVNSEKVKNFFKDYSAIGAIQVTIKVRGSDGLVFSCTNNDAVHSVIPVSDGKIKDSDLQVSFGSSLLDVISGLSGKLKLGIQANFPMFIENKDGASLCQFYVAPASKKKGTVKG